MSEALREQLRNRKIGHLSKLEKVHISFAKLELLEIEAGIRELNACSGIEAVYEMIVEFKARPPMNDTEEG